MLVDLIAIIIEESTQPLTTIEITKLIETKLGKTLDVNQVRLYLVELNKQGRVSSRAETQKERVVRANGLKVRALQAMLWWAPAGEVPERTITEAVPGIILTDTSGRKPGVRNSKNRKIVKQEITQSASENIGLMILAIEKLVAERTSSLQEELAATKAELELLQRKIRNLVGDV